MPSRRRLLGLLTSVPAALLVSCAPSPVISGASDPSAAPSPVEPTQSEEFALAAAWVTGLQALAEELQTNHDAWDADAAAGSWAEAILEKCDSLLDRLLAPDPLTSDQDPIFSVEEAGIPESADLKGFHAQLEEHSQAGIELFGELSTAEASQPERLLCASLGCSAAGAVSFSRAPRADESKPIRFPDTSPDTSFGVALTHVWALIQGLELALDHLTDEDDKKRAATRLRDARELRNDLRDEIAEEAPLQAISYEFPGGTSSRDEIRAGLAELETNLLDALARVVAASGEKAWYEAMIAQVSNVHSWGGSLTFWPGWAELD